MRSLSLFIHRPVLATVINILVLLIGMVAFSKLTIREYPNIDVPVVSVVTAYKGASAYIMESQVTDILEESLSGIDGIEFIASKSRQGSSEISVHFVLNRDADAAASDVRDRVARVRSLMPDEIDEPVIAKVEADATPFMYLALTSSIREPVDVNDIAETQVKDALQTLSGVAEIRILGERRHAMRVWLLKDQMAALNITVTDVETAIRAQNLELPAGLIESGTREFSVYPQTRLSTVDDFKNIIVRSENNHQIRLNDVARIEMGVENERSFARYNQQTTIALGIVKQATANPLTLANDVHERIATLKEELPDDMQLAIPFDSSIFIKGSINSVWSTLFEAFALVLLVIYLFLQSGRATIIPIVAIPVSLVGAFIFMQFLGFSINTLSLLALVLAIGLVVDDAIVMLENIYRHLEEGKSPTQAALDGSKEIGFAIIAMTLTLVAVFAPIAFTEGKTGKLFIEFALTLAGAVLISGFVALTLSPMLCSKLLKKTSSHQASRFFILRGFERVIHMSTNIYSHILQYLLTHKWIGWLTLCSCFVLTVLLLPTPLKTSFIQPLADELSPLEDRQMFYSIAIGAEGVTPKYMIEASKGKEAVYANMPEVEGYFVVAGYPTSTQGISFVSLKPYEEREKSASEVSIDAMKGFFMIPEIFAFAMTPQSLGSGTSTPLSIMIKSSGSYEEILDSGQQLVAKMNQHPGINQVRLDLSLNKPELRIDIDREKAAALGIHVNTVAQTLESLLGSKTVTRFKRKNKQYDVLVQLDKSQRLTPQDIKDIYLRASSGDLVPLNNVVTIQHTTTASELPHFDKYRAAQITAGLNDGYSIGEAVAFLETEFHKINPDMSLGYRDTTREYIESGNSLIYAFVLALLFIYLVLSAQFESFNDPIIILTSILPAFLGALIALKWSGGSLNLYSKIGLITLVGLISKHGILMVEFANQAMSEGKDKYQAIMQAATTRFRPIMMTASATILGAIPLALAHGAGAETRHEIGWVIVGGLSLGTALTLIVVPVVFVSLSRRQASSAGNRSEKTGPNNTIASH